MTPSGGRPLPSGGGAPSSSAPLESNAESSGGHASAPVEPESGTIGPSEESEASTEGEEEEEEAGEGEGEGEGEEEEEEEGAAASEGGDEKAPPAKAAGGPSDLRKGAVRFILFFMGFLGLFMLIDPSCWSNPPSPTCSRIEIANALGVLLAPVLGFSGSHLLLTMFLAAALEMGASALAYHATTDWIETARVAKHGQAIRPLWMKALRSGKKEHVAALKPHMDALNARQSRVTINQFKGMVITWVLLIAIYTWVGLFIAAQCPAATVYTPSITVVAGTTVDINASVSSGHGPYNYTWWAQAQPNGPTVGPVNTYGLTWPFTPPTSITSDTQYVATLQVIDARGNIVVRTTGSFEVVPVGSSTSGLGVAAGGPAHPASVSSTPPGSTSSGCSGSSVNFFGASTNLLASIGPFPLWFLAFSLYTFPCNLIFRRYLKHTALSNRLDDQPPPSPPEPGGSALPLGGSTA